MLRVLVVDDERLARKRLTTVLSTLEEVSVVAEAANGADALAAIAKTDPSVVLLDIEMPEGDGFDVINEVLRHERLPEIVFVTAFNSYAVKAYEHGALDYLLKPITRERLGDALDRARERLRLRSAEERAARLQKRLRALQSEAQTPQASTELWFRQGTERVRLFPRQILYASSDRDYVKIVASNKTLYLRCTIRSLEEQLGAADFLRIHRSHIVRKSAIHTLRRKEPGKVEVELDGGATLPVSASYIASVSALIGGA
ncbi:MAG: LytTR family DNA-binding domain-containing protein [Pseudomonadota bacterium]